jgi:hypothetical protein
MLLNYPDNPDRVGILIILHYQFFIKSVFLEFSPYPTDKKITENNSIYNSLKKNQIPRCKPNKRCERPLQGKLYTSEERD